MARISQDELERLKASVSLQRLVEARGIKLAPHGASGDLAGLCPLREEDTPSLVVTPGKNLWHCFGCDAGGDAIEWVRRTQGVSFRHAVELLRAEDRDGSVIAAGPYAKISTVRKLPPPIARNADDHQVLGQAMDFYHQAFLGSPEAASYLDGRGLGPADDLARHFLIGFGNRTLGYRLPMRNRQAGAEIRGRLEKLGILKPSGHELFTGCITFPVLDEDGRVATVYGRKIGKALPAGTPAHLYLPGPHRGVWNEAGLAGAEDVILCEAILDALTFWAAGFRNVTASFGVHGFTEDLLAALRRHGTRRVLIAYDRDDAGDGAALTLAQKLLPEGLACYRVQFPRGMDANEYARSVGPPDASLGLVLRSAAWLGQGKPPAQATVTMVPRLGSGHAAKEEATSPLPPAAEPPPAPVSVAAPQASPPTPEATVTPPGSGPAPPPLPLAAAAPPTPPLAASPAPGATPAVAAEIEDGLVRIPMGDRLYRVIGLFQSQEPGQLRINLTVRREEEFGASGAG